MSVTERCNVTHFNGYANQNLVCGFHQFCLSDHTVDLNGSSVGNMLLKRLNYFPCVEDVTKLTPMMIYM